MSSVERDPAVRAPAGTDPDIWEGQPPDRQRVVGGLTYGIDGHDIIVWAAVVQYENGALRTPEIHLEIHDDDEMTATQARELAEVLLMAADEIDGWVAR